MKRWLMTMAVALSLGSAAWAQHETSTPAELSASTSPALAAQTSPHPTIPANAGWAGAMVAIVAGMFVAAAIIGPVVRAMMPQDSPPVGGHEETEAAHHH